MKELKFALFTIKKNIANNAELRGSFFMNVFGMFVNDITFIVIWVFFVKSVGIIGGWTVADVIGLQGFNALCFGIVCSVGAGIRKLPECVSSGSFDRFMLSPKNLLVRVAVASFGVSAAGDIIFGITALAIFSFLIRVSAHQIFLILFLVIITVVVFFSIAVIVYSFSFFFTDADSVTMGLFDFFLTPSMFHGGAFQGAMRFVFTFLIPSLLIGTLPVEIVRNLSMEKLALVSILAVFWFIFSIKFFNYAVRRYESANFMTFGS